MSYKQPVKERVRTLALGHAVQALTQSRQQAPLVLVGELWEVVEWACAQLLRAGLPKKLLKAVAAECEAWVHLYDARIEAKGPEDLKVLYLAGPEPLNDLKVLLACGVNPHNVWGVESQSRQFQAALDEVTQAGIPLKLYPGDLADFFEVYHETFDIVYFDACGPFPEARTLRPICELLLHQRLTPLSVLITNVCEVPSEHTDRYVDLISSYFRFRYRDVPLAIHQSDLEPEEFVHDDAALKPFVKGHVSELYSEFVTRLIVDLARYWLPNCRALALPGVFHSCFASRNTAIDAARQMYRAPEHPKTIEDFIDGLGDGWLAPRRFPVLSFYKAVERQYPNDAVINILGNPTLRGRALKELLHFASLLAEIGDGYAGLASEQLLAGISHSWFDRRLRFSCDIPMPHLLVNTLLGMYGRPHFINPRQSIRVQYKAKVQEMFCDVLLLDQCRYYFDWFPTVEAAPSRFESVSFQVLARCILDRVHWHDWSSDSHPFRGAAVAGMGEIESAAPYELQPRKLIAG